MWPFRRRRVEVDLTSDVFRRWLRAHRPPWAWFLQQTEITQETLAGLGDEYTDAVAIANGYASTNPAAAELGVAAMKGNPDAEEGLVRQIADACVRRITRKAPAAETFGGFGARRTSEVVDNGNQPPGTLFGRAPEAS